MLCARMERRAHVMRFDRCCIATTLVLGGCVLGEDGDFHYPKQGGSPDGTGIGDTYFKNGDDPNNPFFKSLGTNGRSCGSCHLQDEGWTITPAGVQARFDATDGMDPIFRLNDGSVSPNADVSSTAAR